MRRYSEAVKADETANAAVSRHDFRRAGNPYRHPLQLGGGLAIAGKGSLKIEKEELLRGQWGRRPSIIQESLDSGCTKKKLVSIVESKILPMGIRAPLECTP
jgi:hypothetical protein